MKNEKKCVQNGLNILKREENKKRELGQEELKSGFNLAIKSKQEKILKGGSSANQKGQKNQIKSQNLSKPNQDHVLTGKNYK